MKNNTDKKHPELGNLTWDEYKKVKKSVYSVYKEPPKYKDNGIELLTRATMWYKKK